MDILAASHYIALIVNIQALIMRSNINLKSAIRIPSLKILFSKNRYKCSAWNDFI